MSWGDVAERVRRTRAVRRQTQADFAHEVGISVRTLGSLEAGDGRQYDEITIARVESTLGWAAGSIARVVEGMPPIVEHDPRLARIVDGWPRLPDDFRSVLAELVGFVLRIDGDRTYGPGDTSGG